MKFTSLDKIVRGVLLQKRWPIHFYIECLVHAQRCLEEISFDSLGNVRTVKLDINEYGAATLPCDYMDFCKIGIPNGQKVIPLSQNSGITRLNNYDASGNKVLFPTNNSSNTSSFVWFNDNLEQTGRFYGYAGNAGQSFKILKERNEIQVDNALAANSIILEYISDGSESDNATKINPYAKSTIESYIFWKYKENSRSVGEGERQRARHSFDHDHKILRARLNPLTITDIKTIFRRHTHGSIKG